MLEEALKRGWYVTLIAYEDEQYTVVLHADYVDRADDVKVHGVAATLAEAIAIAVRLTEAK